VGAVQFSLNGDILASASSRDYNNPESEACGVRLWRCRGWEPVAFLSRQEFDGLGGLAFHPSRPLLAIKDTGSRQVDCYKIDYGLLSDSAGERGSRRYGNAKVVLIGDTGVGKSGLGLVLSGQPYKATDSTHGRNVWTVEAEEVEVPGGGTQAREVLLWDLAGQPQCRLVPRVRRVPPGEFVIFVSRWCDTE
jgi:hypothetical protein